jgi:glycosyltransferase involved in cell wall biosynthesis
MSTNASADSRLGLSILIRSLNEGDRIAAAIESVQPLGAEIVVVDSGSTDETLHIARSLGAVVFYHPWAGYGPQRRWGEERCSHNLILSLDADEVVTPALVQEIRHIISARDVPRLMMLRKTSIWPHHTAAPRWAFSHKQILLYDRRIARTLPFPHWDKLEIDIDERPYELTNPILHYSQRDWSHAVEKLNYVARLGAASEAGRSRAFLVFRLLTEFPVAFFKGYVLRRYFVAGTEGFSHAMVFAFSRFIRIAMMLERRDYGGEDQQRAQSNRPVSAAQPGASPQRVSGTKLNHGRS